MPIYAIPLSKGFSTLVDEEDFARFGSLKWYAVVHGNGRIYAYRKPAAGRTIYLHREIVKAQPGSDVDHINGDCLDNRRQNIRVCSRAENCHNRRIKVRGSSKFVGVYFDRRRNTWCARCFHSWRSYYLGGFTSEEDAAKARDAFVRKERGAFARLNFPMGNELPIVFRERE